MLLCLLAFNQAIILCFSFSASHLRLQTTQKITMVHLRPTKRYMADPINDVQVQSTSATADDNEPIRVRKRWRRRKDSSVVPVNNVDDAIKNQIETSDAQKIDANTESSEQYTERKSACPIYSMSFPRYKINLTSSPLPKDVTKEESEQRRIRRVQRGKIIKLVKPNKSPDNDQRKGGIMDGIFGALNNVGSNALTKGGDVRAVKSIESMYSDGVKRGKFRWVSSSTQQQEGKDEDFHAAAAFWRMASDIASQSNILKQEQNEEQSWYLALPETTPSVARKLCDILNWYSEKSSDNGGTKGDSRDEVIIRADLDTRASGSIPVVRFTVTSNNNSRTDPGQTQQQLQSQRNQLPTADDTTKRTKAWVKRLLVQLGVCPFTKSENKSGQGLRDLNVPVADIMYSHSNALGGVGNDVYLLMAGKCAYLMIFFFYCCKIDKLSSNPIPPTVIPNQIPDAWENISNLVSAGPEKVSSILLSAPGFDDEFDLWAGPIFAMLETCVGAIEAEEMIGIVCFHPKCKS